MTSFFFSGDNKQYVYKSADSIYFVGLGTSKVDIVTNVKAAKRGGVDWLALQKEDGLVIRKLSTNQEYHFVGVKYFEFNPQTTVAIVKTYENSTTELKWFDLKTRETKTIYSSATGDPIIFKFDKSGEQLGFIEVEYNGKRKIWNFVSSERASEIKIDNGILGQDSMLGFGGLMEYSQNGEWLFFNLQPNESDGNNRTSTIVTIRSYADSYIKSIKKGFSKFSGVGDWAVTKTAPKTRKYIKVEDETFRMIIQPGDIRGSKLVLASRCPLPSCSRKTVSYYLYDLHSTSKTQIDWKKAELSNFKFAPSGKYLLFYDCNNSSWVSCDVASNNYFELTSKLHAKFSLTDNEVVTNNPVGIGGWLDNTDVVFIYDRYDIWRINLGDKKLPTNLTGNYGKENQIKFRFIGDNTGPYSLDSNYSLLTAYNNRNKYNGFYKCMLNKSMTPKLLHMGPFVFYRERSQILDGTTDQSLEVSTKPVKATSANVWAVKKQSATECPNYFITNDFISFKRKTDLAPQANVNWITSELINYKTTNGKTFQAVLYKPEDFDSTKKYPIIFNYYEHLSYRLFEFPYPDFTTDNLNIPYFVSMGYLVCTPDIHYSIANVTGTTVGQQASSSIISAAKYCAKLPFVDSKRMGIQGHSFGGYETNSIIVNSEQTFAAACEVAGTCDAISGSLGIVREFGVPIEDKYFGYIYGQGRIGASIWERPDLFIKYSPIYKADKIQTPLLIVHNDGDNSIDWGQGAEMFSALRRLGKPVWWLQYEGQTHSLDEKASPDFTEKLTEYFDYFLKGDKIPAWMPKAL